MARLLDTFRALFEGRIYIHRASNQGDLVAVQLYEDLYNLKRSTKFCDRVDSLTGVVNTKNIATGKKSRRGDGTFGERIDSSTLETDAAFFVGRAPIATIQIGAETKILAKAMIKQIDRVTGDLVRQAAEFRKVTSNVITVALVGLNQAPVYTSFEKDRTYRTDGGSSFRHPAQESKEAERRLRENALSHYDHSIVLRFIATNEEPHQFSWVNEKLTELEYSAMLTRISIDYEERF
jgi:hypothetical protein